MVVRLGLASWCASAYIRTRLCPRLSSYTPRCSSASLVRALSVLPVLIIGLLQISFALPLLQLDRLFPELCDVFADRSV